MIRGLNSPFNTVRKYIATTVAQPLQLEIEGGQIGLPAELLIRGGVAEEKTLYSKAYN